MTQHQTSRDIYTVQRLNKEVKQLLEGNFPLLWVEGEISNLATPASGHIYFTLKDANAQIRCAMFRSRKSLLTFAPESGIQVVLRARVSLYEGRGDFQLIVENMEPAGDGRLRLAFEQLKRQLAAEGLFDEEHKKSLPEYSGCIGVITSATGAALRDILSVLNRRNPETRVIVYPTPVQGEAAGRSIARMIAVVEARNEVDVLLITRGGGSLEDLWAFNEEVVARAIFTCPLPIVSAVGHEIDFTIADFVADARAPTPSAAAELLSPDQQVFRRSLSRLAKALNSAIATQLSQKQQHLRWLQQGLHHPGRRLQELAQRLDDINARMQSTVNHQVQMKHVQISRLAARLQSHNPMYRLQSLQTLNGQLGERLQRAWLQKQQQRTSQLGSLVRTLDSVSPLATLHRGYAIVSRQDDQSIVRSSTQLKPGDKIVNRFSSGSARCSVDEIVND